MRSEITIFSWPTCRLLPGSREPRRQRDAQFSLKADSSGSHTRRAAQLAQLLLRALGSGCLFGRYPLERRSSGDEQPRDADMVGARLTRTMTPAFGCPDQRRGG